MRYGIEITEKEHKALIKAKYDYYKRYGAIFIGNAEVDLKYIAKHQAEYGKANLLLIGDATDIYGTFMPNHYAMLVKAGAYRRAKNLPNDWEPEAPQCIQRMK